MTLTPRLTEPAQRVLVAPDKFKGTLSAEAAARAMAEGWARARPQDDLVLLPISDGGDGFGQLLGRHLQAEAR
jgi:glycerate 2-kinase